MKQLLSKSEGRIFTDSQEHVRRIAEIIGEMDAFEYEYLPDDFITVYSGSFRDLTYNGKFTELDLSELERRCLAEGIPCGAVVGTYHSDGESYVADPGSIRDSVRQFFQTGMWGARQVLSFYELEYVYDSLCQDEHREEVSQITGP